MKNKMSDVRNHLVAMLELLNEDNVPADEMRLRIDRARAVALVAGTYIGAVKTELDALIILDDTTLTSSALDMPSRPDLRLIEGTKSNAAPQP